MQTAETAALQCWYCDRHLGSAEVLRHNASVWPKRRVNLCSHCWRHLRRRAFLVRFSLFAVLLVSAAYVVRGGGNGGMNGPPRPVVVSVGVMVKERSVDATVGLAVLEVSDPGRGAAAGARCVVVILRATDVGTTPLTSGDLPSPYDSQDVMLLTRSGAEFVPTPCGHTSHAWKAGPLQPGRSEVGDVTYAVNAGQVVKGVLVSKLGNAQNASIEWVGPH